MWLGLAFPPDDARVCRRFLVQNNVIWRARRAGILLNRHVDSVVRYNTVHDPVSLNQRKAGTDIDDGGVLSETPEPRSRPLRVGLGHANLRVQHNLLSGPTPLHVNESAGAITLHANRWLTPEQESPFVDPEGGDLHLRAGVAESLAAPPVAAAAKAPDEDLDGRPRGPRPTLGAYQAP